MICAYAPDATDFTTNGLGPLMPLSCEVSETLNGMWELVMVHPIDEYGKHERLALGNIIKAPVPAGRTPAVRYTGGGGTRKIYSVDTGGDRLRLRQTANLSARCLGYYRPGTEVVEIAAQTGDWREVTTPDGKHGFMWAAYLTDTGRTAGTPDEAEGAVIEAKELREQPFRIYALEPGIDRVTVKARHIFYDLADRLLGDLNLESTGGAGAALAILPAIRGGAPDGVRLYTDLDDTAGSADWTDKTPVEAMLGSEGLCEVWGAEIARDWWDVYAVKRVGRDTDIQLRQGKNVKSVGGGWDASNVVTRIVPVGQTKDGKPLHLPEVYVDREDAETPVLVKWQKLDVREAKVGSKDENGHTRTQNDCYDLMREAAAAEFEKGCDVPDFTLDVDFINLSDTVEFADWGQVNDLSLGDSVEIKTRGVGVRLRMTDYVYDCLKRRYKSANFGNVTDTIASSAISAKQFPSGSVTGSKLAFGAVGTGNIAEGSVGSLQIGLAAIESTNIANAAIKTANIDDGAITNAKIGTAAITSAKIDDAAITTAKIADAAVGSAQIGEAAIDTAHIKDAAVGTAQIGDAAITSAKIGEGEIQTAHIEDAAITHAKIGEAAVGSANIENAAIGTAKIADAAVTNAKIGSAAVDTANIKDAAISTAQIANAAITNAKIGSAAVTSAKIGSLAVTTAKIANAAITNAKIGNAAVDTAQIALGAITSALIQNGAIGTAQIADASITDAKVVSLNADVITSGTLATERLIIKGADGIIYEINAKAGGLTTEQLTEEKYKNALSGTVLVAKSVTADQIAAATITANEILAGTITGDKIAAETIDTGNIKAGAITTSKISSDFASSLDLSSNNSINFRVKAAFGGRNLLMPTKDELVMTGAGSSVFELTEYAKTLNATDPLYLSFEAKASTGLYIDWYFRSSEGAHFPSSTSDAFHITTEYTKYACVINQHADLDTRITLTVRQSDSPHGSATSIGTVYLKNVMLERGTEPTSWTPAPEEVNGNVDTAQTTADSAQASINDIEENIDLQLQNVHAQISTSADNIMSVVEKNYAAASDVATLTSQVSTLVDQTAEKFSVTATRIDEMQANMATAQEATEEQLRLIQTYMTFSQDGLVIGKTGNPFTFKVDNERLIFYMNDTEVAYMSNNKLYVTQAQILTRMQLGKFAFEPQSNGNMSLIYTG